MNNEIEHYPEWIKVEDRLPVEGNYVLGFADEWGEFLGWREGKYWRQGPVGTMGEYIALVEYWMPLPEPPTEGKNDD